MASTNTARGNRIEKGKELQKAAPAHAESSFEHMDMEEMERWFDHWFEEHPPHNWLRPYAWEQSLPGELEMPLEAKTPKVEIVEQDEKVIVRAEVPGVDKNDLEILVTDATVTLKGKSADELKENKANYYCSEILHGTFCRKLALPHEVDADKAKASFKNGLLVLTLPKLKKTHCRAVKIK